jgi:hypothetical protein
VRQPEVFSASSAVSLTDLIGSSFLVTAEIGEKSHRDAKFDDYERLPAFDGM